jgi:hypothetical protein
MRVGLGSMEVIREINKRGKLTYTRTSWAKWMTGTIPRQDARRVLGDVLEIPYETLSTVAAKQERDRIAASNAAQAPVPSVPYADASRVVATIGSRDGDVVTLIVNRREFLGPSAGQSLLLPLDAHCRAFSRAHNRYPA